MMIGAVALGLVFLAVGDNLSTTEITLRAVSDRGRWRRSHFERTAEEIPAGARTDSSTVNVTICGRPR
ncbi:MAG: hypothetical protein R2682_10835 [Pyrinomonadaceae bacterium]